MTQTDGSAPPTIINVNDNERILYVVSKMLRRHGFNVVEAKTGREALQLVDTDPDVMVLDVRLPDINGYEVCRTIKTNERTSGIKVLHTSATYITSDNKVRGLQAGADGYLTQPFEAEELVATVEALVRLKAAERELRARADRLAEADRRKDEFLAMLAHELRNPLAALTASLPLLQRFDARDDRETRALEVIGRQTRHLGRLVDDLLDVARVTRGLITLAKDGVSLNTLLQRVVSNAEAQAQGRNQKLILELPENALHVRADPTRLEQVFANLLDNASKYTDPGGTIQVRLAAAADGRGSWASVTVKDSGIGIAHDALAEIFNLFSQSGVSIARSRGGLGIGLTLVRTLVELHGGTVVARSHGLGTGSEFEVRLPLLAEQPQAADTATDKPRSGRASSAPISRRVLIIEDNSDARQALQDLCELWGHRVQVASDGLAGVATALAGEFDYALVDIGLPGIDGYEVARRVTSGRPKQSKMRLVALTGYGSAEQRAEALQSGFELHLVKPVDSQRLFELLARDPSQPLEP